MAITQDLVRTPFRVATSKPAQKTYLNTILFLITSTILLGTAIVAYVLFYMSYIPQIGVERVVFLQYGDGPHPYGLVELKDELISQQKYDISLSLHVPRSPQNLDQGNFMLDLKLLSPNYRPTAQQQVNLLSTALMEVKTDDILFITRRPAILTYTSQLVSLSARICALPFYILGLRRESELLTIPMTESVSFGRGWKNIPGYAMLEVQAGQAMQIYDVRLKFTARFRGLRWIMYNHRILSFLIGTGAFWGFENIFTILSWIFIKKLLPPRKDYLKDSIKGEETDTTTNTKLKAENDTTDEEPDLSDTPRTFPTYRGQAPLRYEPRVKDEVDSEELVLDETAILPLAGEADDEEDGEIEVDGEDYRAVDSGIGTSFSEGGEKGKAVRRRREGK